MAEVLEINATEFKAKCLGLFKDLEAHRYGKVVITRRGKPIAELTQAERRSARPVRLHERLGHHSARLRLDRADPGGHSRGRVRRGPLLKPPCVLLDTCAIDLDGRGSPADAVARLAAIRRAASNHSVSGFPGVGLGDRAARERATRRVSRFCHIASAWFKTCWRKPGIDLTPLGTGRRDRGRRSCRARFIATRRIDC